MRCVEMGGHLASEENDFIVSFKGQNYIWVGGNKSKDDFSWIDGTSFNYFEWDSGQPSNGTQNCLMISRPVKKWHNGFCNESLQSVCKGKLAHLCRVRKSQSSNNCEM